MSSVVHEPGMYEIETASGLYVDLSDPRPEQIRLEAIAHGLAHTCRFAGQTFRFYSVAEHAVHVSHLVCALERPELALVALHHDDAEAFLGDVTRPLKAVLGPAYANATAMMEVAISQALGIPIAAPTAPVVKLADDLALAFEARELLPSAGQGWGYALPDTAQVPAWAHPSILGLGSENAKMVWLRRHYELAGGD